MKTTFEIELTPWRYYMFITYLYAQSCCSRLLMNHQSQVTLFLESHCLSSLSDLVGETWLITDGSRRNDAHFLSTNFLSDFPLTGFYFLSLDIFSWYSQSEDFISYYKREGNNQVALMRVRHLNKTTGQLVNCSCLQRPMRTPWYCSWIWGNKSRILKLLSTCCNIKHWV